MTYHPNGERTLIEVQKQNKTSSGLTLGQESRTLLEGVTLSSSLYENGVTVIVQTSPTNHMIEETPNAKIYVVEDKNIITTKEK